MRIYIFRGVGIATGVSLGRWSNLLVPSVECGENRESRRVPYVSRCRWGSLVTMILPAKATWFRRVISDKHKLYTVSQSQSAGEETATGSINDLWICLRNVYCSTGYTDPGAGWRSVGSEIYARDHTFFLTHHLNIAFACKSR
jgi:hypothetical protein